MKENTMITNLKDSERFFRFASDMGEYACNVKPQVQGFTLDSIQELIYKELVKSVEFEEVKKGVYYNAKIKLYNDEIISLPTDFIPDSWDYEQLTIKKIKELMEAKERKRKINIEASKMFNKRSSYDFFDRYR